MESGRDARNVPRLRSIIQRQPTYRKTAAHTGRTIRETIPMSSSTSATPTPRPFILPANHFSLSGRGVRVDFSETSISGRPLLTYQDTVRTLNFIGDGIRINEVPDIGSIVSVTLSITPDVGSTTFSVLIPHVTVSGPNGSASISTYGITTMHK